MQTFLDQFDLTDEQKEVIVHEAGHAAMAISLHLTPVEVQLGFDGTGVAKVVPEFKGFSANDNNQRVKVLKAGYLAERIYSNKDSDHGKLDRDKINSILIEDCITHLDSNLEKIVQTFLSQNFNTKVIALAELIASNYKKGQNETFTSELESVYKNN